jgi:hypothetical protein
LPAAPTYCAKASHASAADQPARSSGCASHLRAAARSTSVSLSGPLPRRPRCRSGKPRSTSCQKACRDRPSRARASAPSATSGPKMLIQARASGIRGVARQRGAGAPATYCSKLAHATPRAQCRRAGQESHGQGSNSTAGARSSESESGTVSAEIIKPRARDIANLSLPLYSAGAGRPRGRAPAPRPQHHPSGTVPRARTSLCHAFTRSQSTGTTNGTTVVFVVVLKVLVGATGIESVTPSMSTSGDSTHSMA